MNKTSDKARITEAAERAVKAGKTETAIAEYEKILDGGLQDVPVRNLIGDLYLQIRQKEKALKVFLANAVELERRGAYAQALAILKKINRLNPSDMDVVIRMGDLNARLGFVAEAKAEFLTAALELEKAGAAAGLISLYEKLAKFDRGDLGLRLKLARLFLKKGEAKRAAAELNDVADILIVREELQEADKILSEARQVDVKDTRTVFNMARLYSKQGRPEEAVALVEQAVRCGGETEFLGLLGDLYLESQRDQKAREIFYAILDGDPEDANARTKLGWIEVRNGRPDRAYEIFEPLVVSLINKNMEDKAIGLLGLIVMSGTMHLPSLEKLALIYRLDGRRNDLEIVDRVLLEEYRRGKKEDRKAFVLKELMELCPQDSELKRESGSLGKDARMPLEERGPEGSAFLSGKDRDLIRTNMAKADVYLKQGLVRNARRMLENLRLLYPNEARIEQKLAFLKNVPPFEMDEEEISELLEQIDSLEAKIEGKKPPSAKK